MFSSEFELTFICLMLPVALQV